MFVVSYTWNLIINIFFRTNRKGWLDVSEYMSSPPIISYHNHAEKNLCFENESIKNPIELDPRSTFYGIMNPHDTFTMLCKSSNIRIGLASSNNNHAEDKRKGDYDDIIKNMKSDLSSYDFMKGSESWGKTLR